MPVRGRGRLAMRWPAVAVAAAVCAAATGPAGADPRQAPPKADEPAPPPKEMAAGNESRFRVYGFVRLDAIFDDSRPDSFQSPLFILSEGPGGAPKDAGNFTLHPRLTRLGLDYSGPTLEALGGAALSGRIEMDFQNGGRESRGIPRYRHLFLKLAWAESSLLAGQTSDVISPLFPTVNSDTLMWNAGNLGDRRAQVRYAYEPKGDGVRASWTLGLGLTGAVDTKDLDNDGVRDGEASSLPHVQARAALSMPIGSEGKRFEVGISGHAASEETTTAIAGETEFDSSSLGLDVRVPFASRFTFQGEAWQGENLSDFRGGVAQGVNTATGEEIESRGAWVELGFQATPLYALYAGVTRDDPEDGDLGTGGRIRNGASYLVNRLKFGKVLTVGLDYLRWTTEYKGRAKGEDNRFNAYVIYDF